MVKEKLPPYNPSENIPLKNHLEEARTNIRVLQEGERCLEHV